MSRALSHTKVYMVNIKIDHNDADRLLVILHQIAYLLMILAAAYQVGLRVYWLVVDVAQSVSFTIKVVLIVYRSVSYGFT